MTQSEEALEMMQCARCGGYSGAEVLCARCEGEPDEEERTGPRHGEQRHRYVALAVSAWWAIWDRWEERQACSGRLWDSREEAQAYADEMRETAALEEEQG